MSDAYTEKQTAPDGNASTVTVQRKLKKNVQVLKKEAPESVDGQKNTKAKITRVAAYCRVSTDKEEQQSSLKTQIDSFRRLIDGHPGWELIDIYTDEGISGTQVLHRESFNRMIEDCKQGKIDRIITKSISRFARNTVECLSFVRDLKACGVYVYFEKEKLDTELEVSEMALSILAAIAQEESRNLSDNLKWGFRKRFAEGQAKWSPTYGYKKENGEEFVVDPETAPVVQRIFYEYEHGKSLTQIIKGLDDDGIPGAWGGHWYATRVKEILTNEKYIGDAQCQKTYNNDYITHNKVKNDQTVVPGYYIQNHHEPIVSRKTFNRVREILTMNDCHLGPTQYPYKGRITCPICGEKLVRKVLPRNNAPAVWHCPPDHGNTACAGYYIDERYIDEALRKAYHDLDMEEVQKQTKKRDSEIVAAAEAAILMKEELPELDTIEYYFLDEMVDEIRIKKWDAVLIIWKCGLKSRVPISYKNPFDIPFSEKQLETNATKEWIKIAEEAKEEITASEQREETTSDQT